MSFKFERVKEIPELVIIEPSVYKDKRGFFLETYSYRDFSTFGIETQFVQDNHSRSVKGVLRGLHYQLAPMAQSKLIRCIRGEIFDVAVDIRVGAPTFGKWFGTILSEENRKILYIPQGFAHGFVVLSDIAEVAYKVNNLYSSEHERGIIWNDPHIKIQWPVSNPILSKRDRELPSLKDAEINFSY